MNAEMKGNLSTLLKYWHGQFGDGGGKAGDYMACVNALSDEPNVDDPHALCAWLHVQATGKTPGHAANEAHHSDTAAFDFNSSEPRAVNGMWTNGNGAPAVAHTRISGGRHVVTVKRAKGAGYHTHVMRHGKAIAAPKHSATLHAAKATHAAVVKQHAAKKPHGAATPHVGRKGVARPHKSAATPHPGAKGKPHPHAGHPGSHTSRPRAAHHSAFGAHDQEDTMQLVAFDATATLPTLAHDDGYVLRRGKLFEAGEYPDKGYSMTPAEIINAVERFTSCPLDLEHVPTVLDGQLGEVYSIETDDDGRTLFGTVAVPTWLDTVLGGAVKVSCTWDRDSKELARLALVKAPRVADAAIMAAFNAAQEDAEFAAPRQDTYHGQDALQGVHDMAARSGAVCSPDNASAGGYPTFAAAHEVKAMQMIHDHAVNHGAQCLVIPPRKAAMAAQEAPVQDEKKFMDHVRAFFMGEAGQPREIETHVALSPVVATIAPAPKVEDSAAFKAAQAEIATLREERITTQAAAFADGEIAASRALPAERAALLASFAQAAKDDAAIGGVVTFAAGTETKEGTRVDALVALCAARPAHTLTQPGPQGEARVIDNIITSAKFGAEQPMSAERKKELHMQTPEGRAFLAAQEQRAK